MIVSTTMTILWLQVQYLQTVWDTTMLADLIRGNQGISTERVKHGVGERRETSLVKTNQGAIGDDAEALNSTVQRNTTDTPIKTHMFKWNPPTPKVNSTNSTTAQTLENAASRRMLLTFGKNVNSTATEPLLYGSQNKNAISAINFHNVGEMCESVDNDI